MNEGQKMQSYEDMSLNEFIREPDTVDFTYPNSNRFQAYIQDKPYIKVGTVLTAGGYVVAYTKTEYMEQIFADLGGDITEIYPLMLSLLSVESNEAAGITPVQLQPYLNLTGNGVLLGIIDTGIDYTKDAFIYEDGTSKIKYIWDQTIDGSPPANIQFGSVYSQEQISAALQSPDPLEAVPSVDTVGHGTFLASVAGGRGRNQYMGAAPDSEIIAVKLQPSIRNYGRVLQPDTDSDHYASTDFMLGIKFILDRAGELNRPVVICIGMGSNFGGHDGNTLFEQYISVATQRAGIICVAAAGNESNAKHHTNGVIERSGTTSTFSINVASSESFPFYIWSAAFDKMSVEVISPVGETTSRIPFQPGSVYNKKFILESSSVTVSYYKDTNNVAVVYVEDPTPGIWNVNVHGDTVINGEYDVWLPITGAISPGMQFLRPIPNTTVVVPSTASRIICCGAYNSYNGSLYVSSSWGPTRSKRLAPDFVAPGVDVQGVFPSGYGSMSGTSVSAAVATGACALLLQWGIVNGNEPGMTLDRARALLISGCERSESITYPNPQTGFGRLNLFNVFEFLKET